MGLRVPGVSGFGLWGVRLFVCFVVGCLIWWGVCVLGGRDSVVVRERVFSLTRCSRA